MHSLHHVHKKYAKCFFYYNFKIVHKFSTNAARSHSNQCQTACVKTIHFTCRVYIHYLVMLRETKLWRNGGISHKFQQTENCFCLNPRGFANNNVKLCYFCHNFDSPTLQYSVHTHIRWSGQISHHFCRHNVEISMRFYMLWKTQPGILLKSSGGKILQSVIFEISRLTEMYVSFQTFDITDIKCLK